MVKVFDKATGDAYERSSVVKLGVGEHKDVDRILLWIKNAHGSNSIKFKIIVNLGGDDGDGIQVETTLAAGATWYDSIIQSWKSIWFEIKNAIAGRNESEGVCLRAAKPCQGDAPQILLCVIAIFNCTICGKKMTPYTPDLTSLIYGPLDIEGASGDLENPMELLYCCLSCKYYSAQQPVEVRLV